MKTKDKILMYIELDGFSVFTVKGLTYFCDNIDDVLDKYVVASEINSCDMDLIPYEDIEEV